MKELKIRVTLEEEMLGTASARQNIHHEYIASKAPNAPSVKEEIEAIGEEQVERMAMTIFPRVDGNPVMWDYQIKGLFKDACGMLRKVTGSESSKIKAFKKEIDGLIFVSPRAIPINVNGEIGNCQRPLRASTPQGERVALANSETVPAGSTMEFAVKCLSDSHVKAVMEWLDYGTLRGRGQWRNSGKGRFSFEIVE